ncbi:MAG: transcriptional regulator [Lysobacter sp.]|nr:transcriptional regulator [Lysobacter sp.]
MHNRFQIANLQVHPDRNFVIRGEEEIPLEPREMQLLVAVAGKAGDVIGKDELLIKLWGGDFYGDNPVNKAMSSLRKKIGDDIHAPRYIKTLRGKGYKIIPTVVILDDYHHLPKQTEAWTRGSPFVGLSAFDSDHAQVFSGRDRMIAELFGAMRAQIDLERRFVLIVGASGCGKSSLLRAGALPFMTTPGGFGGLEALTVADCDLATSPAGDPMLQLAAALSSWFLGDRPIFLSRPAEDLKLHLTEAPESVAPTIEHAFRCHPVRGAQPHAHLLLTIDHAEALVAPGHDPNATAAFERVLQAICDTPRTLVVMIARGDCYPELSQALPKLTALKTGCGHIDVLAPERGEIAEIIRTPAWQAGLKFGINAITRQRLDDTMLADSVERPDVLPLLQHALQALYERRTDDNTLTYAAYEAIGRIGGAIAHRADAVFRALPDSAKRTLDTVLAKLIVVQAENDFVGGRRVAIDTLDNDARVLVEAFIQGRLFATDFDDGHAFFGVAHEALLRQWPVIKEWIERNQRLLQARARLEIATKRWLISGRAHDYLLNAGTPLMEAIEVSEAPAHVIMPLTDDEREFLARSNQRRLRNRRLRAGAVAALTVLAIISCSMAFLANMQRNKLSELTVVIGEFTDEIDPSGNLVLIENVSTKVLEYCDGLGDSNMSANDMVICSRASRKLGEVRMEQNQLQDAETLIRRSVDLSKRAVDIDPRSSLVLNEAGQAAAWLGKLRKRQGDLKGAREAWLEYESLSERLTSAYPNDHESHIQRSYALTNLGSIEDELGHYPQAVEHYLRSNQLKKQALAVRNEDATLRFEMAVTDSLICRTYAKMGKLQVARKCYSGAIQAIQALLKDKPDARDWERQLANLMQFQAAIELDLGETMLAEKSISRSIQHLAFLRRMEPGNDSLAGFLANAHLMASTIAIAREDWPANEDHLRAAMAVLDPKPSSPSSWKRMAATINFRQSLYDTHGVDAKNANKLFMEKSIEALRKLVELNTSDRYARFALVDALLVRAKHSLTPGHTEPGKNRDAVEAMTYLDHLNRDDDIQVVAFKVRATDLLDSRAIPCDWANRLESSGYRNSAISPGKSRPPCHNDTEMNP